MKNRKKGIILIQISIFLIASALLFNTYRDKNQEKEVVIEIIADTDPDTNSFRNIEYSGFDLAGNRYELKAKKANFKTETPELINMNEVVAKFYLKDNTILTVVSEKGIYNNITLDMIFKKNVNSTYLTHTLTSNQLSYSNSIGKLVATGNVRGESAEKGKFTADNVEYDINNKNLNISMFDEKQVNVKLKN